MADSTRLEIPDVHSPTKLSVPTDLPETSDVNLPPDPSRKRARSAQDDAPVALLDNDQTSLTPAKRQAGSPASTTPPMPQTPPADAPDVPTDAAVAQAMHAGAAPEQAYGASGATAPASPVSLTTLPVGVPRDAVGFVIGKGGETVRDLSARSGAHIEVEKEIASTDGAQPATRSFIVTGTRVQVAAAQVLIAEKVATLIRSRGMAGGAGGGESAAAVKFEVWVPADRVGMVIGTGGAMIKQLKEKSQASVVVHNEKVNALGQKLVTISGGQDEATHARKLVMDILRKPKPMSNTTANTQQQNVFGGMAMSVPGFGGFLPMGYGTSPGSAPSTSAYTAPGVGVNSGHETRVVNIPSSVVGIVIGKGGETIRDLQLRSGAHVKVTPDSEAIPGAPERAITITGTVDAMELAHNMLFDLVNEGLQRNAARKSGGGGSSSGVNDLGSGTGDGGALMYPSASITVVLSVSNDKVGLIIGKGGATIRELQQRSGARIVVAKEEPSNKETNTRPVTVTGPARFVEAAKALINEKMSGQGNQPVSQVYPQVATYSQDLANSSQFMYPGAPVTLQALYPGATSGYSFNRGYNPSLNYMAGTDSGTYGQPGTFQTQPPVSPSSTGKTESHDRGLRHGGR